MPRRWDAAADARLLIGIVSSTSNIDYQHLAQFMGDGCTPKAIRHRISRLKELYDLMGDTPNGTPSKRKRGLSNSSNKKNKNARSHTPDASVAVPIEGAVAIEEAEPSKAENSQTQHIKHEDNEMEDLFSTQPFQGIDDHEDPFA